MRCLEILTVLAVGSAGGLLLASCSDDDGGATVSNKMNWFINCESGSCGSGRAIHDQAMSKKPFTVSCKKINVAGRTDIEFTITDPGAQDDPATPNMNEERPNSSIEVRNGNADARTCNVIVREPPFAGGAAISYIGQCAGSDAMGTCTLTGAANQNGFDWVGTLLCKPVSAQNAPGPTYSIGSSAAPGSPIQIELDNCN